jgi:hypothetical protein
MIRCFATILAKIRMGYPFFWFQAMNMFVRLIDKIRLQFNFGECFWLIKTENIINVLVVTIIQAKLMARCGRYNACEDVQK